MSRNVFVTLGLAGALAVHLGCSPFGAANEQARLEADAGAQDAAGPTPLVDAGSSDAMALPTCAPADLAFVVTNDAEMTNVGTFATNVKTTFSRSQDFPKASDDIPKGDHAPSTGRSVDFGPVPVTEPGARAIDFDDELVAAAVAGSALTITGWIRIWDSAGGAGGNRLLSTFRGGKGLELIQEERTLAVGINEFADLGGWEGQSSNLLPSQSTGGAWTFFGVVYQTEPPDGDAGVTFYIGAPDLAADLRQTVPYFKGPIVAGAKLAIGNFPNPDPERKAQDGSSRVPRALLYDLRVFRRALDLDAVRCVQRHPN